VLVVRAVFAGARAHTARPWMGKNAIHAAAPVLARLATHESDVVDVDGLAYREAMQVVRMDGGIPDKYNVVPDTCSLVVNRRFAPCYTPDDAEAQVRSLLRGADAVEVLQAQAGAPPALGEPLVRAFVDAGSLPVRPKLGWTDVARFAGRGVPALNFGPGDPEIAHTRDEHVTRSSLEHAYGVLARFVGLTSS
jgi:succinyl-diaminopimelate desuccinylase